MTVAASELRAAVRAGTVPAALPSGGTFAKTGATLARAYEGAWLGCRLLAARRGQAGLVRFYRAVGTAVEPPAAAVVAALHESIASFTTQWRAYLKTELS